MKALAIVAPFTLAVQEVDIPEARDGYLLAKVERVGVCGTDVHLLDGSSAFLASGVTRYPVRFGHEWSGRIVGVGAGVDPSLIGKLAVSDPFQSCGQCLTCRSGHYNLCPNRVELGVRGSVPGAAAEYFTIPAACMRSVPDNVGPAAAVIAEPAVTVLSAFEVAGVQSGEAICVIGTGTLGLIAVQIAAALGCEVDVVGVDTAGCELATAFGAKRAWSPEQVPADCYSVVIEASGAASAGEVMVRCAAPAGRVSQVGIPARPSAAFPVADVVVKGLIIRGVLGGVALMPRALNLISRGTIQASGLIEAEVPVYHADDAFACLCAPSGSRRRPKLLLDMSSLGEWSPPQGWGSVVVGRTP